jgi:hypothetical protein
MTRCRIIISLGLLVLVHLRAQAFAPNGIVVIDGNSLTTLRGNLAHWPTCATDGTCVHALADVLQDALGTPPSLGFVTAGLGGAGSADLIKRAPTTVDPHLYLRKPINLVIVWEGSNDLVHGLGVSGAIHGLTAYVTARHAVGWRVLTLTVIPRHELGGAVTPAAFESLRLALNTQLRLGATGADGVIDIASAPDFASASAPLGPLYLGDHVHLNEAGIRKAARVIANSAPLQAELKR